MSLRAVGVGMELHKSNHSFEIYNLTQLGVVFPFARKLSVCYSTWLGTDMTIADKWETVSLGWSTWDPLVPGYIPVSNSSTPPEKLCESH